MFFTRARLVVRGLFVLLSVAMFPVNTTRAENDKPNIVFILADDHDK